MVTKTSPTQDEFEWPTWLLLVGVYAAWALLVWHHESLAWWALVPLGAYVTCLHGHLQHEVIHGHPTRNQSFNDLLVMIPLGIWIPYKIYKEMHVDHHRSETLADPVSDPESFYVEPDAWQRMSKFQRALLTANHSFAGRLTIGPFLCLHAFWKSEIKKLIAGNLRNLKTWTLHLALVAIVLSFVSVICGMTVWHYTVFFVLPGLSLTLMRSFLEHRPAPEHDQRTAIVEGSWITQLLFLNNNFHVIHHRKPHLSWYRIQKEYRGSEAEIAKENGGYVFRNYLQIATQYGLSPKGSPVYSEVGSKR